VASAVSSVTGAAQQYLSNHPDANAAVTAAQNAPRSQAAIDLRNYFTGHPQEYFDLRGILAPIGDIQRQCNTSGLSPDMESAYNEFMAG
jgi:hemophore-related protein